MEPDILSQDLQIMAGFEDDEWVTICRRSDEGPLVVVSQERLKTNLAEQGNWVFVVVYYAGRYHRLMGTEPLQYIVLG